MLKRAARLRSKNGSRGSAFATASRVSRREEQAHEIPEIVPLKFDEGAFVGR
jgi:hypothetical protein